MGGGPSTGKLIPSQNRRRQLLSRLKKRAKAVVPRIRDVNVIDKYR